MFAFRSLFDEVILEHGKVVSVIPCLDLLQELELVCQTSFMSLRSVDRQDFHREVLVSFSIVQEWYQSLKKRAE